MNIRELDEAQGLTDEMVRVYLRDKLHFTCEKPSSDGHVWLHPEGHENQGLIWPPVIGLDMAIKHCAAVRFHCWATAATVQAVLREINPRMRKGPPSKEARDAARPYYWLASWDSGCRKAANLWDSALMDTFADSPDSVGWHFWPCDAAGNKVRWPEKDGVML